MNRSLWSSLGQKLSDFGFPVPEKGKLRFFATLSVFFLISFNYDILRSIKISLIVSGQHAGAEIIPFIKIWGILPSTILMTLLFTFLLQRMVLEKVFYVMISVFLSFFLLFLIVIYPNRDFFELKSVGDYLQTILPTGAKGFVAMVRYWHYTLLYIFGELWGNIILNMLFWGFVNEVTLFSDAKRFYSVFALSANMAPIAAGRFCLSLKGDNWGSSLNVFIITILLVGLMIIALFYYLNRVSVPQSSVFVKGKKNTEKEEKAGFSLREGFNFVRKTPYLFYLGTTVIGYYIVYNLSDILWTDQIGQRFQNDTAGMNEYLNKVCIFKGILGVFLALFVSGRVIQRFGWRVAALVTPVLLALTCFLFFGSVVFDQGFLGDVVISSFSSPFIQVVVFIGAIQHCLVRASKQTVFDATKEMAFIPLNRQSQRMGKAMIDGIGARVGKSGGSLIFQILLLFLGSLSLTVPYVAAISAIILVAWFFSINRLNKEIQAYTSGERVEDF